MKRNLSIAVLLLVTFAGTLMAREKTLYPYKYYLEKVSWYQREFSAYDKFITFKNFTLAMLDPLYNVDDSDYGIARWHLYRENPDKMAGEIVADIFRENPAGVTIRAIEYGLLDAIGKEKQKLQRAVSEHNFQYISYARLSMGGRYVYQAMHARHYRVIREYYFYLFRLALNSSR